MNKRIILVGGAGSGKDFLKNKFVDKGFIPDISYTSRPPREGEKDGVDYWFTSEKEFKRLLGGDYFYEWAHHGDYFYGTSQSHWEEADIFIMEPHGISQITEEDRLSCFIIYLNIPLDVRIERMKERGWTEETITHRIEMDNKKFIPFLDYDIMINNPDF